jgi:hypothetical protein
MLFKLKSVSSKTLEGNLVKREKYSRLQNACDGIVVGNLEVDDSLEQGTDLVALENETVETQVDHNQRHVRFAEIVDDDHFDLLLLHDDRFPTQVLILHF